MTSRTLTALTATLALVLLAVAPAAAQDRQDSDRFGLGLGFGVVEPDDAGELYYMGSFRIRLWGDDDDEDRDEDDWRYASRGDIEAYIEPEIGYWEADGGRSSESDLLLGVNGIGVVPGRTVDYFFGVGLGYHFLDRDIRSPGDVRRAVDDSDEVFGGNFQVGLDIHLSDAVSLFGAGRFDILEDIDDTLQGKVYMGLRFTFGDDDEDDDEDDD